MRRGRREWRVLAATHGPPANKKQAAGGLSVSETHRVSKTATLGYAFRLLLSNI
jgi:hypothetical protein